MRDCFSRVFYTIGEREVLSASRFGEKTRREGPGLTMNSAAVSDSTSGRAVLSDEEEAKSRQTLRCFLRRVHKIERVSQEERVHASRRHDSL